MPGSVGYSISARLTEGDPPGLGAAPKGKAGTKFCPAGIDTCSPRSEHIGHVDPDLMHQQEDSIQQIQPDDMHSEEVGGSLSLSCSFLKQKLPLKCYSSSYPAKSPCSKDIGREKY